MRKTDISVHELVSMVERGELRLPEMQRQYVWRAPRVRDLLDSLYRGYPSGSILVWETDAERPTRDLAIKQEISPFTGHKLLLDGQQRLTSLSAVLRGEPVHVRRRKRPIDILFNLEHPDSLEELIEVDEDDDDSVDENEGDPSDNDEDDESEEEEGDELLERFNRLTFVVSARRLAVLPQWVSVTKVFANDDDGAILQEAGVRDFLDPRFKRYSDRLKRLRAIADYQYSMHVLDRDLSYEEVAEIFVRVNSLGAKLRGSDLALAQITARWQNSLALFERFQHECINAGYEIDLGTLVRALVVFATGQCRFLTVGSIAAEKLEEGWERAKRALQFAINFLKTNSNLEAPVLLTSPYFLITTGYLAKQRDYRFTQEAEAKLRFWLLLANARAWYSVSSETVLDQDLAICRGDLPFDGLVARLMARFGRLYIEPVDLQGRNVRSGMFKMLYMVLRAKGAKDWVSGLMISLKHQGRQDKLQFHHIHPKARLKGIYSSKQINDLANFAFISGSTNRRIGAKSPADYFPKVRTDYGEEAFSSQCVPTDQELLTAEGYPRFLEIRREMLTREINDYLKRIAIIGGIDIK